MISVKKRDGRKEPFVAEKIVVSALKSGASPEVARSIAHGIEQNATDGITTGRSKEKYWGCSNRKILNGKETGWSLILP